MRKNRLILRSQLAILLLLLSASTLSGACRFLPRVPRDHVVQVRPIPRDAIAAADKGDTIRIPPGGAFVSDSYVIEIRNARTSEKSYALHPIAELDIIVNDTRDTIETTAPKIGWVSTAFYLLEVMKARVGK